jgi:hypothetical protein
MKVVVFIPERGGTDEHTRVLAYMQLSEQHIYVYDLPSLEKRLKEYMSSTETIIVVLLGHGTPDNGDLDEGEVLHCV